jgi:two-component system OmpR family response regulator
MTEAKILYIDDEEDLVDLAKSFFLEEDLAIDTCTSFQAALDLIKKNDYDLIISDARMPTGSGVHLMTVVKLEKYFSGKCILVTGNVEPTDELELAGFDKILYKPIKFHDLIDEVKQLLSKG